MTDTTPVLDVKTGNQPQDQCRFAAGIFNDFMKDDDYDWHRLRDKMIEALAAETITTQAEQIAELREALKNILNVAERPGSRIDFTNEDVWVEYQEVGQVQLDAARQVLKNTAKEL